MPSRFELEHIDERYWKDILAIWSTALFYYQNVWKRAVPKKVKAKWEKAYDECMELCPPDHIVEVFIEVPKTKDGKEYYSKGINCTVSFSRIRRNKYMGSRYSSDDYDCEDDEYDDDDEEDD